MLLGELYKNSKDLLENPLLRIVHGYVENSNDLDSDQHPEIRKQLKEIKEKRLKEIISYFRICLENSKWEDFLDTARIFKIAVEDASTWERNVKFTYEFKLNRAVEKFQRRHGGSMRFCLNELFDSPLNAAERKGYKRAAKKLGIPLINDKRGRKSQEK